MDWGAGRSHNLPAVIIIVIIVLIIVIINIIIVVIIIIIIMISNGLGGGSHAQFASRQTLLPGPYTIVLLIWWIKTEIRCLRMPFFLLLS